MALIDKHAILEKNATLLLAASFLVVTVGGIVEIAPLFYLENTIEKVDGMRPYSPLELAGRNIYVREGCYNCHSQMIRPIRAETERYGEYSKPGEFIYDRPFQWGSRRIGPDLHRIGGKYPDLWHVRHMQDPQSTTPQSIMPAYAWLETSELDFASAQKRVDAMAMLGVPYGDAVLHAERMARQQSQEIAQRILSQGGPQNLEDKQITALVAYLQRLGTDIKQKGL
jgi:cbb3-type cytochrome c oxidase subunit II